jgi:hypothetical protein
MRIMRRISKQKSDSLICKTSTIYFVRFLYFLFLSTIKPNPPAHRKKNRLDQPPERTTKNKEKNTTKKSDESRTTKTTTNTYVGSHTSTQSAHTRV